MLVYAFPLFLALFGYRVGSFEREAGIVPFLQIACRRTIFAYARRLILASLPLVLVNVAVAGSMICLEANYGRTGAALLLHTLVGLVLLVALYSIFWICVLLLIAMSSIIPAAALLRISMVWLKVCLLVPACADQLAAALYPTMSRPEYVNRVRAANDALTRDPQRLCALYRTRHPDRGDASSTAKLPNAGIMALIAAEITDHAAEEIDLELQEAQRRQDRLTRMLSFASPALLLQRQMDKLAGEDLARQQKFFPPRTGTFKSCATSIAISCRPTRPTLIASRNIPASSGGTPKPFITSETARRNKACLASMMPSPRRRRMAQYLSEGQMAKDVRTTRQKVAIRAGFTELDRPLSPKKHWNMQKSCARY